MRVLWDRDPSTVRKVTRTTRPTNNGMSATQADAACVESDRLIIAAPEGVKRRGHSAPGKGDSPAKVQGDVLWMNQVKGLVWISLGVEDVDRMPTSGQPIVRT